MARARRARAVLTALAALILAGAATAGCVSMPSGGPVISYPVTQGTNAQNQQNVQIIPQPPAPGWSPEQIVQGFLTASASFGNHSQVAREYLTPTERTQWDPRWSAAVYKKGPNVSAASYPAATPKKQATVAITGQVQATLKGYGSYSVSSSSGPDASAIPQPYFHLVKLANQWRIDSAPPEYLLTSDSFANDYQLRNLYFFDRLTRVLVPDPVYVPLQATPADLMNGLVHDLVAPPNDWLSGGATKTAFPAGTKITDVSLDGVTAIVNLSGSIAKTSTPAAGSVLQQVSAQLLWTLSGSAPSGPSGQAVQSIEVELNGRAWAPPRSQENPVQQRQNAAYSPASGASPAYYYVSSTGYLARRSGITGDPVHIAHIGTQYQQIAVSPDGKYLAALNGGRLYAGLVGGALAKRGGGYVAMSWDAHDNLWASTGAQIVMLRAGAGAGQPLGQAVPFDVNSNGIHNLSGPFSALRVAPDGVRVAIVTGGTAMNFGAISLSHGTITLSPVIVNAPASATFSALTWYGPDNVIALASTLGQSASAVTEYPVSGGPPTAIPADSQLETITASPGQPLIAGLPQGRLAADESLTDSWVLVDSGSLPTYPG